MTKNRVLTGLFLVAALVAMASVPGFAECPDDFLADVPVMGRADVERLANLGVDIAEVKDGKVTIVTRPADVARLEGEGFRIERTRNDAASLRERFTAKGKTAADAGAYHTYEETNAELNAYAKNYPKIAKIESIGKTFEKRDVFVLRISGAPAGAKVPKMCVMGLHHSREWISVEVPLAFAKTLLEGYGKDDRITGLVNGRVIYIVPIVNPDGLVWSQTQYSYWRKNRNDNDGNSSKGVDPNRNYGYQWGMAGASASPSSDTYHGKGPFSEACTQNIKRLAEREKFTCDVTYHSYGEMILFPWSYAYNVANPDRAAFEKLGKGMAAFNKYKLQESCSLYPSMGDTDDFMYGQLASLSYTIELARQFIPAESEIGKICDDNVKALLHMLEQTGTVHAKAHPNYASALRFRAHQLNHLAGVANALAATEAAGPKGLLDALDETRAAMLAETKPAADPDGAKFAELSEIARGFTPPAREALRPVLVALKAAWQQESASGRGAKTACERIGAIEELLAIQ